jgi:hypothetical protein
MMTHRTRTGLIVAFLLLGGAWSATSRAAMEQVVMSADVYDGTDSPDGWGAGAMWLGSSANHDAYRLGVSAVSLEGARWGYASGGRTFRIGTGHTWDASARFGKASLEGQADDFKEIGTVLGLGAVPGRLTLVLGDSWLDIGDLEGHLAQGGVDFVGSARWSAGVRYFSGITGDLDDRFTTGRFTYSARSMTWTVGAAVGRTVPFRGAPGSVTQSSTEVYMTVAWPLGTHRMNVAASRFDGEASSRKTLSMAWFIPTSSRRVAAADAPP